MLPEGVTWALVAVIALAVLFDYINGFHDTANAIATSVSTRALRPSHAIAMSASFNFIGALAGTAVAKTIGAGLVDSTDTDMLVISEGRPPRPHTSYLVLGSFSQEPTNTASRTPTTIRSTPNTRWISSFGRPTAIRAPKNAPIRIPSARSTANRTSM